MRWCTCWRSSRLAPRWWPGGGRKRPRSSSGSGCWSLLWHPLPVPAGSSAARHGGPHRRPGWPGGSGAGGRVDRGASSSPRVGSVRRAVPRALARRPLRWLPEAGALLVVAALIGFAVRPYVQKVHGHPGPWPSTTRSRRCSELDSLPIDPTPYLRRADAVLGHLVRRPADGAARRFRPRGRGARCLRALLTWRDPTGVWRTWGLPLAMICARLGGRRCGRLTSFPTSRGPAGD